MSGATILVADDDRGIRTVIREALVRSGHSVRTTDSAGGLWKLIEDGLGDVVVTDVLLPDADGLDLIPAIAERRPGLPVIVMSAQNTLSTAVRATERGAFEYLPKPFDIHELCRAVDAALEGRQRPRAEPQPAPPDDIPMIGRSAPMQEVYRTIARIVPTDLTVLVLGESGTGKELVARALHDLGPRRAGPFVAVNMAAIPRELIESELFGHERGAFTGAIARSSGRFEQAQGGTLFLDEIGDMPPEAQTRLLRVLQSGEFTTVGGARPIRADVRIIAATHKDLRRLIDQGQFREDLYYRLNVVPIRLPPLRARADDIPELAAHFLERAAREGLPRKVLDPSAIAWLKAQSWPGNVRELQNAMRRLAALARDDVVTASVCEAYLARDAAPAAEPASGSAGWPRTTRSLSDLVADWLEAEASRHGALPAEGLYEHVLAEVERPLLRHALLRTGGNQLRAARLLGVNRNTLRKMLSQRAVDPRDLRRNSMRAEPGGG
ncbi:MAG: nitrogen regulation protein NR(I) [Sphingomonadaceae bacterium]|uniref:nitrogen regulation protein NR(I) n=1 Tax=Thermaurantiacus sp. TaxID=2820283 RepID=UPI00298F18F2|nr:nitrogen regulation protein NR(I) [Thermaurantiacus sp.]MCS6985839.1 nitrogen regulation protein NR(I) [Sphingomonadaceae bacterium]MDW8413892.1 nitrogen regulation protein NR(I) [Thermaurantiacus sp.]